MSRISRFTAITMGTLALGAASVLAQAADPKPIESTPIPEYQDSLVALTTATDHAAFDAEMDRLVKMVAGDHAKAIEQLLWYFTRHENHEKTPALVGRVIKAIGLTNDQMIRTLVPHLDNIDSEIRERAASMLKGCEDHSAVRPPNFSIYRAMIEEDVRAGREPRASLIRHMVRSDAGVALLTMVRAFQLRDPAEIKPILWGEHIVADLLWKRQYGFVGPKDVSQEAVAELEKLSRHDRWWVRLYVAEMIRLNAEIAAPGVKDRLANDSNALVREIAASKTAQ